MSITRLPRLLCLLLLLLVLAATTGACRKTPQARSYKEPAANTPAAAPSAMSGSVRPFQPTWTTPTGWREEKGSGMRLASFALGDASSGSGLCTLVPLPGEAGGRIANVRRWLEQLGLPVMADDELHRFMAGQTELRTSGNWPVWVIDFTPLVEKSKRPLAMLSAIVAAGKHTLFVKLTGSPTLLRANREKFFALCHSLHEEGRL